MDHSLETTSTSIKPKVILYVDVFGHCNLRCPSCTVGNWTGAKRAFSKGMMTEELLRKILVKAQSEMEVTMVGLYNWTEPLLNPDLPRLINTVRDLGLVSAISSNLNILHEPFELMASNPDWFRVSISGFTQDIYSCGHAQGDIEKVKSNMRRLANAKRKTNATTGLECFYHQYQDNEADEIAARAFAEDLGYSFTSASAGFGPVEKLLSYIEYDRELSIISNNDLQTINRLKYDLRDELEKIMKSPVRRCKLQEEQIVVNVEGDVYLCCGASTSPSNRIGSFLDMSFEEIQSRRQQHSLCDKCMASGVASIFDCLEDQDS